jgi:superfamily I DNA and/or RNA helicase
MLSSVTSVMHINNATIDRKLNVAITRARQQLIIIGNPDILCKEGLFAELLSTMEWINPTVLSEKEL